MLEAGWLHNQNHCWNQPKIQTIEPSWLVMVLPIIFGCSLKKQPNNNNNMFFPLMKDGFYFHLASKSLCCVLPHLLLIKTQNGYGTVIRCKILLQFPGAMASRQDSFWLTPPSTGCLWNGSFRPALKQSLIIKRSLPKLQVFTALRVWHSIIAIWNSLNVWLLCLLKSNLFWEW